MAAATSMLDIYANLYKGSYRTFTVTTVRFLLNTYKMPYHYDDFYKELQTAEHHCVAKGGARQAVMYLFNRLDKAGLVEWDELEAAYIKKDAELKTMWGLRRSYSTV